MKNAQVYDFINTLPIACSFQKMIYDENGNPSDYEYITVNKSFEKMYGFKSEETDSKTFRKLHTWDIENQNDWIQKCSGAITHRQTFDKALYNLIPDQWVLAKILPLSDHFFLTLYTDIDEDALSQNTLEGFFSVNLDLLCITNQEGRFIKVNQEFEHILGYKAKEMEHKPILYFVHPDDQSDTQIELNDLKAQHTVNHFTNRFLCKDGSYRYIEWHSQPHGEYIYSSGRDVTRIQEAQLELEHKNNELTSLVSTLNEAKNSLETLAGTDRLTGLYNRYLFDQKISYEMDRSDRYEDPLSMLFYDLDHFKLVNDNYGHPVGDEVLKHTASIFKNVIRTTDMTFRIGGEEFALLMPQTNLKQAEKVAEKIRKAIENTTIPVAGKVTASFGVAERFKSESFKSWYRRVDEALYTAKNTGRNKVIGYTKKDIPAISVQIEWDDSWNSGNSIIDMQHKKLLELGIRIFDSYYANASFDNLLEQIDTLILHIHSHFVQEVDILKEDKYPNFEDHNTLHKFLESKLNKLRNDFLKNEVKASIFFSFILDEVIMDHLVHEDMKFFSYL